MGLTQGRTCAAGKFGKYRPVTEKRASAPEVRKSQGFGALFELWDRSRFPGSDTNSRWLYFRFLSEAGKLDYTPTDVMAFSQTIHALRGEENFGCKIGDFLSALINAGKDGSYALDLTGTDGDFPYLASECCKEIFILGDIGYVGEEMREGTITVQGSAGIVGQRMRGGRIIIEGDCGNVGSGMEGGDILVKGSVRDYISRLGGVCRHRFRDLRGQDNGAGRLREHRQCLQRAD